MKSISVKEVVLTGGCALILVSSFWPWQGEGTVGEAGAPGAAALTMESWTERAYQKNAEERRDKLFGWRNSWVRLKDTLYDLANFGYFHFAYEKSIYEGRHKTVFEELYVKHQFSWDYDAEAPRKQAEKIADAVSELHRELARYNVKLVYCLFPNKVNQLDDSWPMLWRVQRRHHPHPVNWYELLTAEAEKRGVPSINYQALFNGRRGENALWFSKTGTHWTLAMAGAALPAFAQKLKASYGITLPEPRFAEWKKDTRALHEETDIWTLLNLQDWMRERRVQSAGYPYPVYAQKAAFATPMTLYGDSFNGQWEQVLQAAGVTDAATSWQAQNRLLTREESYAVIERGGVFSLGYSLFNLPRDRVVNQVRHLTETLRRPWMASGWHVEGSEAWTDGAATLKFLVPSADRRERIFSADFITKMAGVQQVSVLVNGHPITQKHEADLARPGCWEIALPAGSLKDGVNEVTLRVVRTAMPVSYNINGDRRVLGVRLTHPQIRVAGERVGQ